MKPVDAPIGTLARGLHVLSLVAADGKPVGVTELAKRAELDKGTTHRLAAKLVELGYLQRNDDGKLMLGVHVLDLGFSYLASLDLRTQALPEMRKLHEEYDGSITLAILDGTDIVYVERMSPKGLQASMPVGIGARLPIYCTAMGKVIVAAMAPPARSAILDRISFRKFTDRTITDRATLDADLTLTRERGFGITDQEMVDGLRAVAGVVYDRHDFPVAAISVALPSASCEMAGLIETVGPRVRESAAAVSAHLSAR